MIIETSANQFFRVRPATAPGLEHVWLGTPVKLVKGVWIDRKRGPKAHDQLIRKAATRVVEA